MNGYNKTQLGLEENIESALCYIVGFVTGIIFYILDPENKFVKFHAVQSIATFLPLFIVGMILSAIPYIGWMLSSLIWLLEIALWFILMFKAYQHEKFKLPVVGDIAENMSR